MLGFPRTKAQEVAGLEYLEAISEMFARSRYQAHGVSDG